jgi:hypothetical protein
MYPSNLKEELSSGFDCDTFLTWCKNGHIREPIYNPKKKIITILGGGKI